ncbi:MAG: hypothetical protein CVU04_05775 [Bacteroidetes bacterium HGW-Bacteroidetes-20]|nr:MAG: hypothetical protein CVU04_05775 [Bacteroidetes bacterium HGW-Bacteroidetes-20]
MRTTNCVKLLSLALLVLMFNACGTKDTPGGDVSTRKFAITFDKNDDDAVGAMESQEIAEGSSANLTANSFTKPGWGFAGWAESAAGAVVYADQANYTMGSADVTLYAKWAQNPSYTITFNKNDASAVGTMATQTITSGLSANLNANSFTKPGYSFAGWAESAAGAVVYTDQAKYTMGSADVTLYAKWGQIPTVTTTNLVGNNDYTYSIIGTSAIGSGIIDSGGDSSVIEKGLCWNTTGAPTVNDSKKIDGNGGNYIWTIMGGLTTNTVYYVRAYAINSYGVGYGAEILFNSGKEIGSNYAGGKVFFNNGEGGGLVAAASDQSESKGWTYGGDTRTTWVGTSKGFGSGAVNTTAIINQSGHTDSAAKLCRNLGSAWFLPSQDELDYLYSRSTEVGGFTTTFNHWSSSESNSSRSWVQAMQSGSKDTRDKATGCHVRCIRAF